MKKVFLFSIIILSLTVGIISCKKDSDSGGPKTSPRNVKYEITGNYTGQLTVVISDNVSGTEAVTATSLPWTKEKTYTGNVAGIGIGGNSVVAHLGQPGQTVTLKIYSGGTVVRSGTATSDANGALSLPSLALVF
jgi:hypothetical protein